MAINFPVTVDAIEWMEDNPTYRPKALFRGKCGDFVSVRPCGDKYEGKTYLGIFLGEIALAPSVSYNKETKTVRAGVTMHNPAMFVPDLNEVIFGAGSWWSLIESEDQLRQITNDDINNQWYVKALQQLQNSEDTTDE